DLLERRELESLIRRLRPTNDEALDMAVGEADVARREYFAGQIQLAQPGGIERFDHLRMGSLQHFDPHVELRTAKQWPLRPLRVDRVCRRASAGDTGDLGPPGELRPPRSGARIRAGREKRSRRGGQRHAAQGAGGTTAYSVFSTPCFTG